MVADQKKSKKKKPTVMITFIIGELPMRRSLLERI